MDLTLDVLEDALLDPRELEERSRRRRGQGEREAAVAMMLRGRRPEVLLIERARRGGDPWSGQVALPGGRREPGDSDLLETAIRETHEEVGLGLRRDWLLGGLEELRGHRRAPPLVISCWVFAVPDSVDAGEPEVEEVSSAFWVPVGHLLDDRHAVHYRFGDFESHFPGVLLPDGDNVLWGLTHRFFDQLLTRVELRLSRPGRDSPVLGDRGEAAISRRDGR